MPCIKSFNTEILEENGLDETPFLKVRFSVVYGNGDTLVEEGEYNALNGVSVQQQLSDAVSGFFSEFSYCEPELIEPSIEPSEAPTTLLGLLQAKNDLLNHQNRLISEQTKVISSGNASNGVSIALKEQTAKQDFHNNYATANHIVQTRKTSFEVDGSSDVIDSNDDKIVPMHIKAKYHAEKYIDEHRANTTDLRALLDDDDTSTESMEYPLDFNIMSEILSDFNNVNESDIPENMKEGL